jgi:hypothetical protein
MLYEAFLYAASLVSVGMIDQKHAGDVTINSFAVVLDADDTLTGSTEKDVRLLINWQGHESAGRPYAVGDGGRSLGPMQINKQWAVVLGVSEVDLLDPYRGVQIGYEIMRSLKKTCGSSRALVESRCKESGAC